MYYISTSIKFFALLLMFSTSSFAQNYNTKTTLPDAKDPVDINKTTNVSSQNTTVENVVIVYKTHFDIGYSETIQQVLHDYRTSMADRVLEAIEINGDQPKDEQFVWTVSGWPMKEILWEGQAPGRKKKIEQAIADGNLAVHAFPFTVHSETADPEGMVRGLNISSTLARKYGQPLSISAKMSDVPGHSWFIPTLFTHAGIKFYHMGGPVVNKELGLPGLFWWEGPDGSRLLTKYDNAYGSSKLPPEDWPYKTWIHISMTGDNQGPPSPEIVSKDLEFYKKHGIKAKIGKMDDFAEMILKEDLSGLPVVRSDIGDVWIHGTMSRPEGCKIVQNSRPLIGGLEQLSTLESVWGIYNPDYSKTIAEAYEQSMLYSEHTWGLANQHYLKVPYGRPWQELWEEGLPAQYKLMEESWNDHDDYARNVKRLVTNPYRDVVASLADNVSYEGNRIVVYNPLPWKRDGVIELDTRLIFGNDFVSLEPVDGGEPVIVSHEYPAIEDKAPMSRFVVKDIPPMGYRTYIVSDEKVEEPELLVNEKEGVIESPFFRATLDAGQGCIVSLIDKRTGKELVDEDAPQGFGQYFYERFGYKQLSNWIDKSLYPQYQAHRFAFVAYDMPQDTEYNSAFPENMSLSVIKSAIDVKAVMTGIIPGPGQPQKVSIALTLSGIQPVADLEVSWQKQPDSWPEAAWICLPFKCNNAEFRLGRLGAVVDPEEDMITDNANHHLWWVNNGAAIFDGTNGEGVAICSQDAPLMSIGEPGEYKFDKQYRPKKPYVYLNLYNNHWRTNFSAWIGNGERMSAKVRLWAYDEFETEKTLYSPAREASVPLQVACSKVKNGRLPITQQGIAISRKGVAVTAFGPNPDGEGKILRVWEQAGNSGSCTVKLPEGLAVKSVLPVDLRGRSKGKALDVINREFTFELKKYAPASFLLDF